MFGGGKQLKSLVSVIDVARCMQYVGDNKQIEKETITDKLKEAASPPKIKELMDNNSNHVVMPMKI